MYKTTSPKNKFQRDMNNTSQEAMRPSDEEQHISYGIISKVNYKNGQVQVKELIEDGRIGQLITGGFVPLLNPLSQIHTLYGALREGLVVRIFWRGKHTRNKQNIVVEVIGDEDHTLLNKTPELNEIPVGPYRIFSGGIPI